MGVIHYKAYDNIYKYLIEAGLILSITCMYLVRDISDTAYLNANELSALRLCYFLFILGALSYCIGKVLNKRKAITDFGKDITTKTGITFDRTPQKAKAYIEKCIHQSIQQREELMKNNSMVPVAYQEDLYALNLLQKLHGSLLGDEVAVEITIVELKILYSQIQIIKKNNKNNKYQELPEELGPWKALFEAYFNKKAIKKAEKIVSKSLGNLKYCDMEADNSFANKFLTRALRVEFMQDLYLRIYS